MLVSELIKDIVSLAEDKFGVSDHNNDCISVEIFPSGCDWQAGLVRPTQRQLDNGEIATHNIHTIKVTENKYAFYSEGDTLMEALHNLYVEVNEACGDEFQA